MLISLERYDTLNKPQFQCPKCNLISTMPMELVKHIVKCKKKKMM